MTEGRRVSRRRWLKGVLIAALVGALCGKPERLGKEPHVPLPSRVRNFASIVIPLPKRPERRQWHPSHAVKVWMTNYGERIFRTIQLPRCEHIEMVLTYVPAPGETCARVKKRTRAIAVCTGSYHHPQTMALADFLQRDGRVLYGRRTGRGILTASDKPPVADILDRIARGRGVSALALGSRLVPFQLDGFSPSFANEQTDRMAIGLTKGYVFVVQGRSDLWRLAHFLKHGLGCTKAINSDGGHVVKGRGPVHIAFRWRKPARASSPQPAPKPKHKPRAPAGPATQASRPGVARPD